ncbi:MAG: amidohydrolase family protein [Acidobacteria bacterium]|nr:amidohydrolase family protein [Acidobacteriota bacterium]
MRRAGLLALGVILCSALGWAQNGDVAAKLGAYPQMVLYNGKIVTMDDKSFTSNVGTIVQAMAVRDGKIVAMGNNGEIRALAGSQTKQIDLKGRTVLPSFIMTHEHPVDWAFTEPRAFRHVFPNDDVIISRWLPSLPAKEQLALFEPTMKEAVAKAKPGQWIRVIPNWGPDYEWAEQFSGPVWDEAIKKEYLDVLAPNNPVCISGGFTSACMGNTKTVEEYRKVHPVLDHYSTGRRGRPHSEEVARRIEQTANLDRPTNADVMLRGKLPELAAILKGELELWARSGITAFGGWWYAYSNLHAFHLLDSKGEMPGRLALGYRGPAWDLDTLRMLAGMLGHGTDHIWFIGAFGDGGDCLSVPERSDSTSTRGGGDDWLERCSSAPGTEGWEMNVRIAQSGLRFATMHSGGDKGIDYLMDAIEEGSKRAGMTLEEIRAKRHAFDHGAGAPRPQQIPRIKNLGMMASQLNTILWETHRGAHEIAKQYGIEYTNWVVPRKSLVDAGVMNTFEIDRPLPHKVFFFVTKGMNRYNDRAQMVYGPGEKTDRIAQLKALTTWGGYYLLRENLLGTLGTGKYADFIVLDRDFLTIPEADIPKIDVLMTVVGGKPIHLGAAMAREIGMQPAGLTTWTEPIPSGWEPKPY